MESPNRNIDEARFFHEVTKHSYTSVRTSGHSLDWNNRPIPYKIYPGAGTLALPREIELPSVPALRALHGDLTVNAGTPIGLDTLTRLLFCAGGLTRRVSIGGEDYHFRAAASAGALYPIEIYPVAADVDGLEPGLYHFLPADLKLHGLRRGDWRSYLGDTTDKHDRIENARVLLVLTAIFWRSAWKYRARSYRYCFWDAGTILANIMAAANAEGLRCDVITAFDDAAVETLLEIDPAREGAICIVAVGDTQEPLQAPPEVSGLGFESIPLSESEISFDDLVRLHRASRLGSAEVRDVASTRLEMAPIDVRSGARDVGVVSPQQFALDESMGLGETILRRGSARMFSQEPIPGAELMTILAASSAHPNIDFPRLSETFIIVNAAVDIPSGAYYYRRQTNALELLKAGDFRREAGYLALEQPLGSDCSALIVYMADLERVMAALGNRGYRDAHLEAGILGGKAYLAAYSIDRGATGLTFYDDDTTRFFGTPAAGMSPLLMIAVGVPHRRRTDD